MAKANKKNNRTYQVICDRQIPQTRVCGKLCLCPTEILLSDKNATCPSPEGRGRFSSKVGKP